MIYITIISKKSILDIRGYNGIISKNDKELNEGVAE